MLLHRIKIIAALVLVVLGMAVFVATLVRAVWYAPENSTYSLAMKSHKSIVVPKENPVHLAIPSLKIDADVQYVGVNAKGHMGVPNNFTDVAWYQDGTVPGQVGSAVIDGHVDNGLGLDGVFKHLANIKIGESVFVTTKEGRTLRFIVSDTREYAYDAVPNEVVFNQADIVRLNLITCEGAWVAGKKTYDRRLVVYTTLQGDTP